MSEERDKQRYWDEIAVQCGLYLKCNYLVDRKDPLRQLAEENTRSISLKRNHRGHRISQLDDFSQENIQKEL